MKRYKFIVVSKGEIPLGYLEADPDGELCADSAEELERLELIIQQYKKDSEAMSDNYTEALAKIERLEESLAQRLEQIRQHNENCEADCNYRRADATVGKYCEAHTSRGRNCPECPRQYILD